VRRNVLIFHVGALGDFILSWPLAIALGRIHPTSRIIYITHSEKGKLAERLLGVEWQDIEAGWHHLFSDAQNLLPAARSTLASSHAVYSFISAAQDPWSDNLRRAEPTIALNCLQTTPPTGYSSHVSDYLLDQLRHNPAVAEAVRLILQSIAQRGIARHVRPTDTIIIHPGSG